MPDSFTKSNIPKTWEHLKPKVGVKYFGFIVYAVGCCEGDVIIFDYEFKDAEDNESGGPWLLNDINNFVFNHEHPHRVPALYRFDGWYKVDKNGKGQFGGGQFNSVDIRYE